MQLIYLGAEVPSNRTLLESTSARHVGVSFYRLFKRGLPKRGPYLLENYFKDDFTIYAYPGLPKELEAGSLDMEAFAAMYEEFIANNIDRIASFTEIEARYTSQAFVLEQRKTCWSEVPPGKFLPIWNPEAGLASLTEMSEHYLDIGLPGESLEDNTQLSMVTRTLSRTQGTRFHVLGSARPDNLRQVSAETASTLAWLSPMLNGETIVWDGMQIKRYPKRMKEQARARYRNVYIKAGLDIDLILEDDDQEVCRLAVWSYNQYERKVNGMSDDNSYHDNSKWSEVEQSGETPLAVPDNKAPQVRKFMPRDPSEIGNLPVFGYELKTEIDDDGTIKDVPIVKSKASSIRNCNTCFVAANCPAFKPDNLCAFNLPIEVKTKDQLKSLLNAIVEMQGQRVAFMRFAEEMSGGYADPNVSQEIDRLFKLIKTIKELDDSREFIRMTVERQGSAGVLSSIFGDRANVLRELPEGGLNEMQTTEVIKEIIEDKP